MIPKTREEHIDVLVKWTLERENVRIKKTSGQPAPWTEDEFIKNYKFCNVNRVDDKETIALFNWYTESIEKHGDKDLWFNVAIARWINWSPSVIATGWTDLTNGFDPDDLFNRMSKVDEGKFFTGAYMIRGATKGEFPKTPEGIEMFEKCRNKRYFLAHRVFKGIYEIGPPLPTDTLESYHNRLNKAYSNGDFMAGQQIADLKYFNMKWASDWNTYAPIGPGPTRFLNRLFGRPLTASIPKVQYYEEMEGLKKDYLKKLVEFKDHPAFASVWKAAEDAHNLLSNFLCETDKYIRLMEGGQVRSKYNGAGVAETTKPVSNTYKFF